MILFENDFANTGFLAACYLVLFTIAEILYRKFNFKAELTRKIVHLVTGILSLSFPLLLENHLFVLFLCGSFFIILIFSMKFKLLPSINAVDRKTHGSLLYPVIVYSAFLVQSRYNEYVFYYIPILILAFCDPIAGLTGKKWQYGKYTVFSKSKTIVGSSAFFISASFIVIFCLAFVEKIFWRDIIFLSFGIAFFTTLAEAISHKGYDNLTIPATAMIILLLSKEYFTAF